MSKLGLDSVWVALPSNVVELRIITSLKEQLKHLHAGSGQGREGDWEGKRAREYTNK